MVEDVNEPTPQTNPPSNPPQPSFSKGKIPIDPPLLNGETGGLEKRGIYLCEADLKEGELRGIKAENQWIVLACYQGKIYGLDAACDHSGYPLFKGKLDENGILTCSLHYMKFDCRTGKVASSPPMCEDQPIFQIEVNEGKIYWIREKK